MRSGTTERSRLSSGRIAGESSNIVTEAEDATDKKTVSSGDNRFRQDKLGCFLKIHDFSLVYVGDGIKIYSSIGHFALALYLAVNFFNRKVDFSYFMCYTFIDR